MNLPQRKCKKHLLMLSCLMTGNQIIFLKILSEYLRSLVLYSLKYFCKLKAGYESLVSIPLLFSL